MGQSFPPAELAQHLDAVTDLVRRASDQSLRWYRQLDHVDNKRAADGRAGFDPVTEADRAVEAELRDALASRFPDHQIVGEEFGTSGDGPVRWTIDPIDGTRAFIIGQPMWGTLLGLQIDEQPVAGWMHLPVLSETFVGVGNTDDAEILPSWTRHHTAAGIQTVSVGPTQLLDDAIVLCTHPEMFAHGPEADAFARVAHQARMVRYSGDCLNYGLLAMGLADAVIENGLAPYDIVPLIPIVEGAGGIVTDRAGDRPVDGGFVVASATAVLHQAILDELNR